MQELKAGENRPDQKSNRFEKANPTNPYYTQRKKEQLDKIDCKRYIKNIQKDDQFTERSLYPPIHGAFFALFAITTKNRLFLIRTKANQHTNTFEKHGNKSKEMINVSYLLNGTNLRVQTIRDLCSAQTPAEPGNEDRRNHKKET